MMTNNLRFNLVDELHNLGLELDVKTGHLSYARSFSSIKLECEVVLIRHGETYGNCGQITSDGKIDQRKVKENRKDKMKRVFQGNVDTDINQLTATGIKQAKDAAITLETEFLAAGWMPDIILHSPLNRARQTGQYFVEKNALLDRYVVCADIREISFGAWENRRVCDFATGHHAHTFYLDQNALIAESGINNQGDYQMGESFADMIINANRFLTTLNKEHAGKRIVIFTHSMFGAACCILLGKGKTITGENYLAFDGKDKNGIDYCLPHAQPIPLNFEMRKLTYANLY